MNIQRLSESYLLQSNLNDIKDAIQHFISSNDFDNNHFCFSIKYRTITFDELYNYDDIDSWLEIEKSSLKDLNKEELISELNYFRKGFGNRAYRWIESNSIPPIVIVESNTYSCIGDGRGRINLANGLNINKLDTIFIIQNDNSKLCFQISNGIVL